MKELTIAMPLPERCMKPQCSRVAVAGRRGLCKPCYTTLALLVAKKIVTWLQLERAGCCQPKKESVKSWALSRISA